MNRSITLPEQPAAERGVESAGRVSSSDLIAGDLIGDKYRFEAQIAEGGMGIVLRATHIELGSPVAIKVVRPEHAENEEVVARLLAEARIAASLRSKHVNRVLDVGRFESGAPYLVLEYLEGCTLAERLKDVGHFSPTQAADYVLQACEALAEAHAIGIVHRDLKPENLFLSEEPDGERVLKILDFGISKAPRSHGGRVLTKPWHVVGSPCYMAPEQMQGAEVDGRADVWALGVVLYELCVGRLPFESASVKQIFLRVLREEPIPPSWVLEGGLDTKFEHIIFKCLRKEPDERYANVVELAEALRPFASDPARVARVGRVAESTVGRLIRGRVSDRLSDALSPTTLVALAPTTPLTLAASRLPSFQVALRPRRGRAALLLGMAAAASVALGAALSTPWLPVARFTHAAPMPSGIAAAAPAQPPLPAPQALPTGAELPPASLPVVPPAAAPAAARPAPRHWQVPKVPSRAAAQRAAFAPSPVKPASASVQQVEQVAPLPAAPVATPTPTPPVSPAPSSQGDLDAWNRQSFGGRR